MRLRYPQVHKTQILPNFSNAPFFEKKGWTIIHEKHHFLLDMAFLAKEKTNLPSNFT
jgi:hypothetical protein